MASIITGLHCRDREQQLAARSPHQNPGSRQSEGLNLGRWRGCFLAMGDTWFLPAKGPIASKAWLGVWLRHHFPC